MGFVSRWCDAAGCGDGAYATSRRGSASRRRLNCTGLRSSRTPRSRLRTWLGTLVIGLLVLAFAVFGQSELVLAVTCPTTTPAQTGNFALMSETGSTTGSKVIGPVSFTVTVSPQWTTGPTANINTSPARGRAPAVFVSNGGPTESRGPTNHLLIETSAPVTNLAVTVAFFGTAATERMRNFTVVPVVTGQGALDASNVVVPNSPDGTVVLTWPAALQRVEFDWTSPGGGASYIGTVVSYIAAVCDMGDAPATYGSANAAAATSTLVLGSGFTADLSDKFSADATADTDDALSLPLQSVPGNTGGTYAVAVPLRNATANPATLQGWIDFDRNGTFDAGEMTSVAVPAGATSSVLSWTTSGVPGPSFMRLRLHQDPAGLVGPTGPSSNGEVEDYQLTINAVPVISGPANGTVTPDDTPTITGTGTPGDRIDVRDTDGTLLCSVAVVPPDGTWTCTANSMPDGEHDLVPVATAPDGTQSTGAPVHITVVPPAPALSIIKTTTATDLPPAGGTIPYSFLVTNIGNVELTNVTVTDVATGTPSCPLTTLAPGAATVCTATHTVTQADADAGQVQNTATVTGTPPDGTPIPPTTSNEVDVPGALNPALTIIKATTTSAVLTAGQVVPYTFTVINTGNVTISAINIADTNTTVPQCPLTTLAPGQGTNCTATHTATQGDIDQGQLVNTAAVSGSPAGGVTMTPATSNQVTTPAAQVPALTLVKSTTATTVPPLGATIAYDLVVSNTGNVTLDNITVTDPDTSVTCSPTAVAPSESTTCTASHTVTQADLDAGEIVNTATAAATTPSGTAVTPVASNTVRLSVAQLPTLTIAKTATDTVVPAVGRTMAYSFVVSNTGNVTITDIAVADPDTSGVVCPVANLTPGESTTCTATHTVTQDDIDAGAVVNTATVTGNAPNGTSIVPIASNTVQVSASQAPSLSIIKATTTTETAAGQTVQYLFVVSNTGNVTIVHLEVADVLIPAISCPSVPLAPDQSMLCTGSYTVTEADARNGFVVNTATAIGSTSSGNPVPAASSNELRIRVAPLATESDEPTTTAQPPSTPPTTPATSTPAAQVPTTRPTPPAGELPATGAALTNTLHIAVATLVVGAAVAATSHQRTRRRRQQRN